MPSSSPMHGVRIELARFLDRDFFGLLEHLGLAVDHLLELEKIDLAGVVVVVRFEHGVDAVLLLRGHQHGLLERADDDLALDSAILADSFNDSA